MAETPEARPFSPSMKFIALVANRIHASVTGAASQPRASTPPPGTLSSVIISPLPTANSAAPSWAASLMVKGQFRRSSKKATTAMAVAARITPAK